MKIDTEKFIERAKQVHGDSYDYSNTIYKRSTEKVEIVCPIHGPFYQRPENHVNQRQRCPQCSNIRKGRQERFSIEWMMEHPERAYAPALLYVVEIKTRTTEYIEIGVATKGIKKSYKIDSHTTPLHLRYMSLKQALLLEQEIENVLGDHFIKPVVISGGKTKRLENLPAVRETLNQILAQNEKPS